MPDADYMTYDSTLTSLSGYGGNINFGKQASKGWRYAANFTWRSPGFELNDIGYIRRANTLFQYVWVGYKITEPFSIFNQIGINANEWSGWDYGGTSTFIGGEIGAWLQFKNFWSFNLNITKEGQNVDNTILRGGPAMITPGGFNYSLGIGTNSTKKLTFISHFWDNYGQNKSSRSYGIYTNIRYQPLNVLSISLSPVYNYNKTKLQYITTENYNNEDRYLFGTIDQKTFSMTMRIDFNLTPDFTIQYYGAPFISAGLYSDFFVK